MPSTTISRTRPTAASKIDKEKYGKLLARTLPRPIATEAENAAAIAKIERLCAKAQLSLEEENLLELLSCLVRDFEDRNYAIPPAPPARVLGLLLKNRKLAKKELVPVVGSKAALDAILSGARAPELAEARALGDYFNLEPTAFCGR